MRDSVRCCANASVGSLISSTSSSSVPRLECRLAPASSVSREIVRTYPFLGANLFLMHLQIRAGRTVSETLASLAERVRLDEVSKLGALLQQTEALGTSVASTLRTFSEEMRARRMLRAEEKAHALPAKLVVPLALFIFPVILVVVFLPVIVRSRFIFG